MEEYHALVKKLSKPYDIKVLLITKRYVLHDSNHGVYGMLVFAYLICNL